jgi:hypothetical protein
LPIDTNVFWIVGTAAAPRVSHEAADPARLVGIDAAERGGLRRGTRMPATVAPAPLSM